MQLTAQTVFRTPIATERRCAMVCNRKRIFGLQFGVARWEFRFT